MSKKHKSLIFCLIAIMLISTGCGQKATPVVPSSPTPAEATSAMVEKVFKVGVLGPFTGPAARTGEEMKNATIMAFEEVDYKIGDYTIELVYIDSQSDPEKATRAYEEAVVSGGIQAGVQNWHSSVAAAVMEVTAKHKIPHFFGMGASEVVNEKYHSDPAKYGYWMAKGWPVPTKISVNYVTALEDAIASGTWTPTAKKAAIYAEDTDWGRSFAAGLKQDLQNAGWEIVAEEYFPLDQTEFYPILNKFKDLDPDLIAGTTTSPPAISAFLKQAREVGVRGHIIADGLGWVGEWYDLTGDASDYVLDSIPALVTDESKAFAQAFKDKWGFDASVAPGLLAYDYANFFIAMCEATIEEYGELTSETLYNFAKEKLETGEFTYTGGLVMPEYKYTPDTNPDMVIGKGYFLFPVLQYLDGAGKVVWPDDWKEVDLELPEGQ